MSADEVRAAHLEPVADASATGWPKSWSGSGQTRQWRCCQKGR